MTIEERVIKILSQQLGIDNDIIHPEKTIQDLGGDSLDCVEIMIAMEQNFNIVFDEEGAEKPTTVQNIIDLVGNTLLRLKN